MRRVFSTLQSMEQTATLMFEDNIIDTMAFKVRFYRLNQIC
jgi:hypothetical protein